MQFEDPFNDSNNGRAFPLGSLLLGPPGLAVLFAGRSTRTMGMGLPPTTLKVAAAAPPSATAAPTTATGSPAARPTTTTPAATLSVVLLRPAVGWSVLLVGRSNRSVWLPGIV